MSPQAAPKIEAEAESPEKRKLRVERIKAMIQQASSNQGDGQLAAWRACALIRKFGLDIVDPSLVDTLHKEIHTLRAELEAAKAGMVDEDTGWQPRPTTPPAGVQGLWTQTFQNLNTGAVGPSPFANPNWFGQQAPPPTPVPQAPPPPPGVGPGGSPMMAPAYIASSKFAGKCKTCGKVIDVGDPVRWLKSIGVWCPTTSCYADWLNKQNQAAAWTSPFTP
jgi:hypothetical protein